MAEELSAEVLAVLADPERVLVLLRKASDADDGGDCCDRANAVEEIADQARRLLASMRSTGAARSVEL